MRQRSYLVALIAMALGCSSQGVDGELSGVGTAAGESDPVDMVDDTGLCGNGVVDDGEVCDVAIPVPQEGCCAFVEFCVDEDPCTVDKLVNDGTCLADCDFNETVAANPSAPDQCCPPGATSETDADCMPSCGNGVVDDGETCDPSVEGSCPTVCPDDGDACTIESLVTSDPCNPVCEGLEVIVRESGDGCCPDGASNADDSDCPPDMTGPVCGDGTVDADEECDDGNTADDDGCSADCRIVACAPLSHDGVVSLASTMDSSSGIRELDLTLSMAEIGFGDGSVGDADGLYLISDPSMLLGSNVDLFPRETDFVVGSLSFDASGLLGCGTETVPVTSIDLTELWSAGGEGDLSDAALSLWFFSTQFSLLFGDVDDNDTVTFVDGVLSSIDVDVSFAFEVDYTFEGTFTTYSGGSLTFSGDSVSLTLDDTQVDIPSAFGIQPRSQLVFDLNGSVNAL